MRGGGGDAAAVWLGAGPAAAAGQSGVAAAEGSDGLRSSQAHHQWNLFSA